MRMTHGSTNPCYISNLHQTLQYNNTWHNIPLIVHYRDNNKMLSLNIKHLYFQQCDVINYESKITFEFELNNI